MTMNAQPCLEVAVYDVSNPESFDPLQRDAHRKLATFPGYLTNLPLQGLDDATSRCDLVLWESLDAAKAAAEAIQQDECFIGFMSNIAEVRHFAHYGPIASESLTELSSAPVIEVAAYEANPEVPMIALQASIHRALREVDGAFPAAAARQPKRATAMLDLIGWADQATHAAAPPLLQSRHPELAEFFKGVGEMAVFELFEVVA